MGTMTGVVLLDLRKAFDTVNHQILCQKLSTIGLDDSSVKWFEAYLNDRSQVVSVNGKMSDKRSVTCGVPQGSILGPLLFQIYINDMEMATNCDILLYADDSALLVSGKNLDQIETILSQNLELTSDWLIDNKLSLHLDKTESIVFGPKRKVKNAKLSISCEGEVIKQKQVVNI